MVEIAPFHGLIYNLDLIKDPSKVLAPPYDVIGKEEQEALHRKSPYNIVRLILAREEGGKDRYSNAGETFRRWIEEKVLLKDTRPAIYPYYQTYRVNGRERTRKGFIALLRLEEFGSGKVFPHERTLSRPKEDRLRLMEACKANLCPIFGLYADPLRGVERIFEKALRSPLMDVTDREGVRNLFYRIDDEGLIQKVKEIMEDKFILIADGHHRYETALTYRDLMRKRHKGFTGNEPFNFVMMYFSNIEDEGLTILPTHRLLHTIPEERKKVFIEEARRYFEVEEVKDRETFYRKLEERRTQGPSFGLVMKGLDGYYILAPKPSEVEGLLKGLPEEVRSLDLTILHEVAIKGLLGIGDEAQAGQRHIEYIKDRERAVDMVKEGRYDMAFILNPPDIRDVIRVVKAGHRMPQKSTYFYPKLLSGLVIHSFEV